MEKPVCNQRAATRVFFRGIAMVLLVACTVFLPGILAFAAPVPTKPTGIPVPAAKTYALSPQEQLAVNLLNQARQNEGIEPLKVNLQLSKLAADYALDMRNRKFFAHVDPDGKDPFERMAAVGIDFPNAGENIALSPDVETAHRMLLESPLHRENILNPKFTEIGIGVRPDARGGVYLVQEFIGP